MKARRPAAVTIIACGFIAGGVAGLAYHASEIDLQHPFEFELVWAAGIRLLAVLGGAFALRGRNWARWPWSRWRCPPRTPALTWRCIS